MGLRTGRCGLDPDYPALLVLNTVLGGGVSSKLFLNVREKLSLCYYAGSTLDKTKGLLLISSGIETANYEAAKTEILAQLDACKTGDITDEELEKARRYILFAYDSAMDSPGSLENYYVGQAIDGLDESLAQLSDRVRAVTREDVVAAAQGLQLDTIYFLKGVEA
jgi:predicted Zn-dependent peptidase